MSRPATLATAGATRYGVPVPDSARPLPTAGRAAAVLAQARREWAALRRRGGRPRSGAMSATEYEARWSGQRSAARWQTAATLAEAVRLSSYGDGPLRALLGFRAYEVAAPDFFAWRAATIARIVGAYAAPGDPVVELGCGLGKNLLALAAHGFSDLAGVDVSPSAVRAVREQFAHFGVPVRVCEGDLLDLAPVRGLVAGRTVLTNYVLEQLPHHLDAALDQIAAAAPVQVLHIEPCPDRLPGRRAWERWPSVWHARSHDYQRGLLAALRRRHDAGAVRVTEVTPLGFSPYLFHSAVLIRWEPCRMEPRDG